MNQGAVATTATLCFRRFLETAPTIGSTPSPFRRIRTVGVERTLYWLAMPELPSMFSLSALIAAASSSARPSGTGLGQSGVEKRRSSGCLIVHQPTFGQSKGHLLSYLEWPKEQPEAPEDRKSCKARWI